MLSDAISALGMKEMARSYTGIFKIGEKAAGLVTHVQVVEEFRGAEDPNDVVVLCDVADVTKARAWAASDELKTAMEKGGVVAITLRFAAAA
jgi:hypothetical protein